MNRILRCDWLPEQARWSYLAHSGLRALSRKKIFSLKPSLLGQDGWILASFFFCEFMDLDINTPKKNLTNIPPS